MSPASSRLERNRTMPMHTEPCENCSCHGPPDPEMCDVEQWIADGDDWREFAFPCAWRPAKLCYSFARYRDINGEFNS